MTEVELALTAALRAEGMVGITAILEADINCITVHLYDMLGHPLTVYRITDDQPFTCEDDVAFEAYRIKRHLLAWAHAHKRRRRSS